MNDVLMRIVISYLEPMRNYTYVMRKFFSEEEMDDFDKWYVALYTDFEDLVNRHLQDPTSPLMMLMKNYQELVVDYEDSILFDCLNALNGGYKKRLIYDEGRYDVYKTYISEKCGNVYAEMFNQLIIDETYKEEVKYLTDLIFKVEPLEIVEKISKIYLRYFG